MNTREKRAQEKLRRERDEIIEECIRIRKNFVVIPIWHIAMVNLLLDKPPPDYKPPKKQKKIYLPTDDPDAKYIGMIIGPKGETQKKLEQKTNTKISIRGKGSAKVIWWSWHKSTNDVISKKESKSTLKINCTCWFSQKTKKM